MCIHTYIHNYICICIYINNHLCVYFLYTEIRKAMRLISKQMAAIRNVLTQADGSQQLDDRVSQTNYLEETGSSTTSRVCWTRSIHACKF